MISIPISFVTAAALAALALRLWIKEDHQGPFLALLLVCAGQTGLITLAHHYGVGKARQIMPITACVIPPLVLIAFETMRGGRTVWAWILMIGAVSGAALWRLTMPALLDIWIPALFVLIAGMIIWNTGRNAEFNNANLAAADQPRVFWRWIAGMLILSALSDVMIFALLAGAAPAHKFMAITLMSSLNLCALGAFVFFTDGNFVPFIERPALRSVGNENTSEEVMRQITEVVINDRVYLDPELSVARLARV